MPLLDRDSKEMTGNEGMSDATKLPSWSIVRGIVVHGRHLNPETTGAFRLIVIFAD